MNHVAKFRFLGRYTLYSSLKKMDKHKKRNEESSVISFVLVKMNANPCVNKFVSYQTNLFPNNFRTVCVQFLDSEEVQYFSWDVLSFNNFDQGTGSHWKGH